jgi:hypothetical protein
MINEWVIEDTRKLRNSYEFLIISNQNEDTCYQNMSNAAKAVLRGKFIVMNTYIKRTRDISGK